MSAPTADGWPGHLRPGAVRFARESANYEATVAFYRDLVGLPIVGGFVASFGEDGTVFGLPDTTLQLEIIRAHQSSVSAFDTLVFYLDNAEAVAAATAPLRRAGLAPATEQHPYWAANDAVTFHDPDGREVIYAPWVYGRDPEEPEATPDGSAPGG